MNARHHDPSVFGHVAVLLGGDSAEREVSLDSGRNVLQALRARGVRADAVDGIPNLVRELQAKHFDRVFNILHGGAGENGTLQGLLDALGVPYTGAGVLGSALTMDKIRTKQVWIADGLPTPAFRRLPPGADVRAAADTMGLPLFLKPSSEGSSVGAFRVTDAAELERAAGFAAGYPGELLLEQLVDGDELTVAILGDEALPSIRIVAKQGWYDYHAKYQADDTQYLCPGLDAAGEEAIRALALRAFNVAGCSGWGRVDVMRDNASGALLLLEVNTAPGMTSHSLVPKAASQVGIDFEELCWRILEQSLEART
jgi:D-alanine-D-alanine ligase